MNKKIFLGVSVAVSLFAITACGGDDADEENAGGDESSEQEGAPQAPDLESIPDVVAVVNGSEILKEDFVSVYEGQFQQLAMQAQTTGEDVDEEQLKEQTAENMVNNELLVQEADDRGFDASQEDIDETMNELAAQNGLESGEDFMAALEEQGMGEEEVRAELEVQVRVDQLIADEAGDTDPTEEELQELYDEAEAQQEQMGEEAQELPPFDEVKPQLEEQAKADKESEVAQALVQDLRGDAEVSINL
ncbi:SurA N-terminal domain-containing protein [Phytoactinopolyspora endophytica]|uniref:SurA N-terminal domain-containing protein n=1 Tax=Phytoactinopolyspora endophytica TaxID=1642495 RepID=UPI00101B6146|nr:SurA N-terminal domain-containing protein [Phytoactinopolyspora endophytica]